MPYLHNETKEGICIKIEFNPRKNISLIQHGRRFFVYSSNMAAVTSCEHTLLDQHFWFFNKIAQNYSSMKSYNVNYGLL